MCCINIIKYNILREHFLIANVYASLHLCVCVHFYRTDTGVHALHSSVHVDLERRHPAPYDPLILTLGLNRFFWRENIAVRVHSVEHVPATFHARYSVQSRTYLYRFAVTKNPLLPSANFGQYTNYMPIEEVDRCHFIL